MVMTEDKIRKSFVRQQSNSDCGVACLASIIKYFEGEAYLEQLRKLSGTTKEGTSILGLYQAAGQIGFEVSALNAKNVSQLKEIIGPAILLVTLEDGRNHYIAYFKSEKERNLILDPSENVKWISDVELDNIWKSKALLIFKPNSAFEKSHAIKKEKLGWIMELIKEDIPILLIMGFLGLIITVLGLSVGVFSQKLIDNILPEKNLKELILGLSLVGVLLLIRHLIAFTRGKIVIRQGRDLNLKIIERFYGSLLRLQKSFFDGRNTGDFIARMSDAQRIQKTISVVSGEIMVDILLIIVCLVAVFSYSMEIFLLMICLLPFYFWIVYKYNVPITNGQRDVMKSYSITESHFIDTLQGISTIKSLNKQDEFDTRNRSIYGFFQDKIYNLGTLGLRFGFVSNVLGVVFTVSVLIGCSYQVLNSNIKIGEMVAILSFAGLVIPSVNKLAMVNIQLQEARIAFERMYEFASSTPESTEVGEKIDSNIEDIKIHGIQFRFPGAKSLLKGINLTLQKGELTVLLGDSGGGKSTFIQILMKFYEYTYGEILVNSLFDFKNIDTNDWRSRVGYVPQEIKVFNGTILENISLGISDSVDSLVIALCKELGLDSIFSSFPLGYETLVGEAGINLSGGQKQLLGLARVLLNKPEVLLLDEFTGAMDRNTENLVLELLMKLKSNMIILVVTHKIKPALIADRVYILEDGRIVKEGTTRELLDGENLLSSAYKEIVQF
jgi:ATP-binding cassette, subfamily C, bacteriocin exporter